VDPEQKDLSRETITDRTKTVQESGKQKPNDMNPQNVDTNGVKNCIENKCRNCVMSVVPLVDFLNALLAGAKCYDPKKK
jgi:hypothetical protein